MEEKEQQYRKDKESHLSELTTKLQERDREIHILEEKLKSAESSPQSETSVVPRLSENVAVCTEQEEADSQGCVHNACEEKLGVLQRNLIEKEMLVQRLEQEKEEIISSHSEIQCRYQELLIKIEQAEAKQHEDRVMINQLQEELEGKTRNTPWFLPSIWKQKETKITQGQSRTWKMWLTMSRKRSRGRT